MLQPLWFKTPEHAGPPPPPGRSSRSGAGQGGVEPRNLQSTSSSAPQILLGQKCKAHGNNAGLVQAFDPSSSYFGASPERRADVESRTSHTRTSLLEGLLGRLLPYHLLHREGRGLACFDT